MTVFKVGQLEHSVPVPKRKKYIRIRIDQLLSYATSYAFMHRRQQSSQGNYNIHYTCLSLDNVNETIKCLHIYSRGTLYLPGNLIIIGRKYIYVQYWGS